VNPSVLQWILRSYAVVLLVVGIASYTEGAQHAPIALVGGVGGGVLVFVLSMLYRRRVFWSRPALVTAVGVFTLSFVWRSIEAFASGQRHTALLLTTLGVLSLPVFVLLLRMWNR
jgi:hypothetical protein